jgi:hypothetical protein
MPYPVESKNLTRNLDEEEYRQVISVWQTSRNTKHACRRLRDDPDFYDTIKREINYGWRTDDVPLDPIWLRSQERRLRNMGVPLKKLKTPTSDRDLELNTDGLKNLAMSLAS